MRNVGAFFFFVLLLGSESLTRGSVLAGFNWKAVTVNSFGFSI